MTLVIVLLGLIVLGVVAVVLYNGLVKASVAVQEAWAQIDVQLKRRHDLIPNLVNTVKGYAAHESGVFEKVTEARAAAVNASGPAAAAEAENVLTGALRSVFAVAEAYPQLMASANFVSLQAELSATEDRVAFARQYYNDSVRSLNTKVRTFPWMLVASMAKVSVAEFYEIPAGESTAPDVTF